jgi:8-oxo-dGTP diphosphatase
MPLGSFVIRVYGLWIREGHVLLSDETYQGRFLRKFPGGGVEFGEGLEEALTREWQEECGLEIEVVHHMHTVSRSVFSAFHENVQVIPVYFEVLPKRYATVKGLPEINGIEKQQLCWKSIDSIEVTDLTFASDWEVIQKLQSNR